jgi:hypothetical protein
MSNSSTGSTATKVATTAAASASHLPSSGSTATTTATTPSTASATKTFTKAPAPVAAASSTSRQSGSSTRRTPAKTGGGGATASSYLPLLQAGLPLILFTILGLWVTSHAYGGKLRELEASRGQSSLSLRQAALAQEHDSMMERLNRIAAQDFDNKRILRPEEILEQRRLARQRRNAWHRRLYRWVAGIREKEDVE